MADDHGEKLATFMDVTGCDDAEALQMLEVRILTCFSRDDEGVLGVRAGGILRQLSAE